MQDKGISRDKVIKTLREYKKRDLTYQSGRILGSMCTCPHPVALEAYAMFDSGLEQRLQAFAPDLAARAEGLFWQGSADEEGLANALARQAALSEVKQVRDPRKLDEACESAMRQIEEKDYTAVLRRFGMAEIWMYGIAFCDKRCRVVAKRGEAAEDLY